MELPGERLRDCDDLLLPRLLDRNDGQDDRAGLYGPMRRVVPLGQYVNIVFIMANKRRESMNMENETGGL